jgi:hypothetical protein
MFFNNVAVNLKLEIKGTFLIFTDPATGTFVELLDAKKI